MKYAVIGTGFFHCAILLYILRIVLLVGAWPTETSLTYKSPIMMEIRSGAIGLGLIGIGLMLLAVIIPDTKGTRGTARDYAASSTKV